jgi:glutamate N-acetyltransferase/amino-acid N-acetyltransferase
MVRVRGARTVGDAERVAGTIARSPLCKTAFFGGDPYAGRIVCAAGYSGAVFDPEKMDVYLDDVQVVRRGREIVGAVEGRAAAVVRQAERIAGIKGRMRALSARYGSGGG